tara:strand:+ start:79 stop:636 length:558 start_codon:yes stop_codon:yes gene_type:complete
MNKFEFIMVLLSIIIGMGIAETLKTVSRFMKDKTHLGSLHILWSVSTLIALIQLFWASWKTEYRADWTFIDLTIVITPAIIMYLIASLLLIPKKETKNLDLYFINQRFPFFLLQLSLIILFTISDYVFVEGSFDRNVIRGLVFILFSFLAYTKNKTWHITGVTILISIQIAWILIYSYQLSKLIA